eukprot:g5595.t1
MSFARLALCLSLAAGASASALSSIAINDIDGEPLDLGELAGGGALLISNFGEDGLQVLAVPSGTFNQELPAAAQIASFARRDMRFEGVVAEKVDVNGPRTHPLFKLLKGPPFEGEVAWNFEKWLVDAAGRVVMRYEESIAADDEDVRDDIRRLLQGGEDGREDAQEEL